MKQLTKRQTEILDFIQQAITETGAPPTRIEIANYFGFRSANAAEDHLKALAKKGEIILKSGTSRGIQLITNKSKKVPNFRKIEPVQVIDHASNKPHLSSNVSSTHFSSTRNNRNNTQGTGKNNVVPFTKVAINEFEQLPIVGSVAAGEPILATGNIESHINIDTSVFSRTPDYLLRVRGDSMQDIGIMDGDILAVKSAVTAENNQVVVARLDTDVTVKRFKRENEQSKTIELIAENPAYEPIFVDLEHQEFAIEGIAVGVIRNTIH